MGCIIRETCSLALVVLLLLSACTINNGLTGAVVGLPASVQAMVSCKNVTWTEEEVIMGTCTEINNRVSCLDAPLNLSCTTIQENFNYTCSQGKQTVTKSKQDCDTTGYVINNVHLNTIDYKCDVIDNSGVITATCDSVFDGNGDGVCGSGESCTRFVVDGTSVTRTEKNSGDTWVASDESYFLERADVTS
ncbi:hypothetical protein J4207_03765 [Candidatus Woesearchaeota archaeon]|nr:hypothetical protein [Candidatus Woesearchaeota archaeon]